MHILNTRIRARAPRFNVGGLFGGLIGGLVLFLIFTSCFGFFNIFRPVVSDSGNIVTETYDFSGFTAVVAEEGFEVVITESDNFAISVTMDERAIDKVQIGRTGDALHLGLAPYDFRTLTFKAVISMPDLYELTLLTGAHGEVSGFSSSQDFVLVLSGGSHVVMIGSAWDLDLKTSGGSHFDLSKFQVRNANVEMSGGCHGTINVDERIDADLKGGSHLKHVGDPALGNIKKSQGSIIEKKRW
jgi:hypothetical protein